MIKAKRIAFLGLMLGIILVLSALEHMLPPLPLLPPNVKLGLSNIVTMYCVFFVGKRDAFMLTVLKSAFVFLMRGVMAAFLSICGGLLSIAVIMLFAACFGSKTSYTVISIFGAVAHNFGQLIAVSFSVGSSVVLYYFPVLLVSGVIMGSVTGVLLNVVMPALNRFKMKT